MLERATREWAISPKIPTVSPSSRPSLSRIVKTSRRAWVGCSWAPSPALITEHCSRSARSFGTPGQEWRTTTASGLIASRLRAVSMRLSPLERLLPEAEKLTASALRRFSAISKEMRVLVLASKKKLMMVLPRRMGTFLISRVEISFMFAAVSRTSPISGAVSPSIPRRCRFDQPTY